SNESLTPVAIFERNKDHVGLIYSPAIYEAPIGLQVGKNKFPLGKEDPAPAVRKKVVMDPDFALTARVKKIHFERGVENLRERPEFAGDQGRGISVHGDHGAPGDE